MTPAPIRCWNRFWFGPISARPLGAYRILVGLIVLANLALLAPESGTWLSESGLLRGDEARELATALRPSPLQYIQGPVFVRAWIVATATAAVLFTAGWRTRWTGIALYLLQLGIHHRNLLTASGADSMLMIVLFLLMLSPCGAAYSLDALCEARRRGTPAEPLILPWTQRLIQFQLALVYLVTALMKSNGSTWAHGTALHYVLTNGEVRRFSLGLTSSPELINAMTLGAVLLEFALPFLLWFRAARPWICLAGAGLHAGILLTVNIPLFGELMVATYLLFLTPQELDALIRRIPFARRLARPIRRSARGTRGDQRSDPSSPRKRSASADRGSVRSHRDRTGAELQQSRP